VVLDLALVVLELLFESLFVLLHLRKAVLDVPEHVGVILLARGGLGLVVGLGGGEAGVGLQLFEGRLMRGAQVGGHAELGLLQVGVLVLEFFGLHGGERVVLVVVVLLRGGLVLLVLLGRHVGCVGSSLGSLRNDFCSHRRVEVSLGPCLNGSVRGVVSLH